jgi:hypothetical protein
MPRKQQILASWIFGILTLLFLMFVYLKGGNTHDPIIRLIAAILAGLMGFFLTGSMRVISEGKIGSFGKISIQAGGGAAFFTLVWLTWPKEPAINTQYMIKETASSTVKELLSNPEMLKELIKSAEHPDDTQEAIANRNKMLQVTLLLEKYEETHPLPPDVREQLEFVEKAMHNLNSFLLLKLTQELLILAADGLSPDAIIEETGLPAIADLQIRYMLPREKLKDSLPKGFWTWSPELRANWVAEASSVVILVNSAKDVNSPPDNIMLFQKRSPHANVNEGFHAVHFGGNVQYYKQDEFVSLIKKQTGGWQKAWDQMIAIESKDVKS